ncbi:MAG: 30S ribosomal protein S16 [Verrucomicrobiota bacterium]
MAVIIRLRRDGAKNSPYYRIVVADKHSPRDGKFLELIGTYDPKKTGDNSTVKLDRADHWIKNGAQAVGHRAQHPQEGPRQVGQGSRRRNRDRHRLTSEPVRTHETLPGICGAQPRR